MERLTRSVAGGATVLIGVVVRADGIAPNSVASYDAGTTPVPGYTDPQVALGDPERFTGEGVFPSVVSVFNPPFLATELVSIGEGGHLTLEYAQPITDHPLNPFGADLIVFGNGGFIDRAFPSGRIGNPPGTFGFDDMNVEVSQDGSTFFDLGTFTEGLSPTIGYRDSGPYDSTPGSIPTDFNVPVDPQITIADFADKSHDEVIDMYLGAGGGMAIDIAPSGLASVSFVRISVADDAMPATNLNVEIDAITVVRPVPAPSAAILIGFMAIGSRRRSR